MSKKIRLIGLISGAFIIALGIIALCIFSAKNVGDVKYLEVSSASQNSVDLSWKKVGSAEKNYGNGLQDCISSLTSG